jgi:hypothetical protein
MRGNDGAEQPGFGFIPTGLEHAVTVQQLEILQRRLMAMLVEGSRNTEADREMLEFAAKLGALHRKIDRALGRDLRNARHLLDKGLEGLFQQWPAVIGRTHHPLKHFRECTKARVLSDWLGNTARNELVPQLGCSSRDHLLRCVRGIADRNLETEREYRNEVIALLQIAIGWGGMLTGLLGLLLSIAIAIWL